MPSKDKPSYKDGQEFHTDEGVMINDFTKVCPMCKDHVRGEPMEVHDCKNLFYKETVDGKQEIVGQCCCWSEFHGKRE